jgi:hypothetical protein
LEGLKEFNGDSSVKIWIRRARDLLKLARLNPEDEVLALKLRLSQPVYTTMDLRLKERALLNKPVNAETFFRELTRAYGNDADAVTQMLDLLGRPQKQNESVLKFVHWFDQELGYLDPDFKTSSKHQQMLARAFLKNLGNQKLQDALETMGSKTPWTTFAAVRDAAVRLAHENKEKYLKYNPAAGSTPKSKDKAPDKGVVGEGKPTNFNKGKKDKGKRKLEDTPAPDSKKKPQAVPKCFNCGKSGHKVPECTEPKDKAKILERKEQAFKKTKPSN